MSADLVERLREAADGKATFCWTKAALLREAADELERLQADRREWIPWPNPGSGGIVQQ